MRSEDWDARYAEATDSPADGDRTVWASEPNAWLREQLSALPPGTAVDLACGEGRTALWLAERGWRVTGVDWSGVGLATAERRASRLGVTATWVRADVTSWRPPQPVDLVVVAYLQLSAPELHAALRAAVDAVAPGGRLVWIGHHVENLTSGVGGPQEALLLQDEEALVAGTDALEVEECGRWLRPVQGSKRPAIDAVLVARRPPGHGGTR